MHYAKESGHGTKEVVGRFAFQELDYRTTDTPINKSKLKLDVMRTTDHMSEAVVAPDCSMTSGATWIVVRTSKRYMTLEPLTPIWTANHCVVRDSSCGRTSDSKVGKLYTPILVGQDIGTFDVAVNDTLIMQVDEPFQHLGDVHCYEIFRKLSESFAYSVQ